MGNHSKGRKASGKPSFAQILEQEKKAAQAAEASRAPLFAQALGSIVLEGESSAQLDRARSLEGMKAVFAFPDIHPGKGIPIGAACVSQGWLHPHLAGSDAGCGVLLCRLEGPAPRGFERLAAKDWSKTGRCFDDELDALAAQDMALARRWGLFRDKMGTIGGGNHFAEVGFVEEAEAGCGLEAGDWTLMVHTGSRSLGEALARDWSDRFKAGPGRAGDPAAEAWLAGQDYALAWGALNRAACAARIAEGLGCEAVEVAQAWHNGIERLVPEEGAWPSWADPEAGALFVHRKGASKASAGSLLPLPTSRGEPSWLLAMPESLDGFGFSCAHGAGRKWRRSECKGRLEELTSAKELRRPKGSFVHCPNEDLLWQEAPQAYKNGASVLSALSEGMGARSVAKIRPALTIKA